MRQLDPAGTVLFHQRAPADWITADGLTPHNTDGIRAILLERYRNWSPSLRRLISDNDGLYVDRPIFTLPVPHTWEHSSTVTLLGDAAHLVPPLGVGVNLAMLDACELALALTRDHLLSTQLPDFSARSNH